MTIACDLHVHSIRSTCGCHTMLEIVDIMKERNLPGFALTDHSPLHNVPPEHFSVMLARMPKFIRGVRMFKGIEATILDEEGAIGIVRKEGYPYDIVLAGLHEFAAFREPLGRERNTRAVINVMRAHPEVKVITHPFYRTFPLDLDAVTDVALETGTALEVNNAYLLTAKADTEALEELLTLAVKKGVQLSVDSDGHTINEIGAFDLALEFMRPFSVPEEQIVNRTFESTLAFLGLED